MALLWLPLSGRAQEADAGAAATEPELLLPVAVQEKVREWVRVKKQISAERADWEAEKQSLSDLNALREKEISQLDELIEAAGSRLADAEKQRADLREEEANLRERRKLLEARITKLETALREVVPRFPPPLRNQVEPVLARLETADSEASLQDRYRDLLTVLGEAGQFDRTLTIDSEIRAIDGEQVEVQVLYLGLARAWYVDRAGRHAGTGIPTAEGWRWTENPSVAPSVRRAIAIRRKEAAPAIVSLPFPAPTVTGTEE